jgi:hypothetical protein
MSIADGKMMVLFGLVLVLVLLLVLGGPCFAIVSLINIDLLASLCNK